MPVEKGYNKAEEIGKILADATAFIKSASNEPPVSCIFISHQREDTEACEPIAKYLMDAGVNVYFDKYDLTLTQVVQEGNPDKITKRIQDGINESTHMLCVVSKNTVKSYWVPFEVGYGYSRIPLAVLTLKGIPDESLPDYMRTTDVIRGTHSLNDFITKLTGQSAETLAQRGAIKKHFEAHPLDNVLDWDR
ncbi:MAG: toll/interleukin-1 receptor domain-containing protein [Acidobacteriota bacterium]|nr:toll/interleukin-1 receptor domain-containing protein [Acidobacteriota bacterium]